MAGNAKAPKRHKSFRSTKPANVGLIEFDLGDEEETWSETFSAHPQLQGAVLLEIVAELSNVQEPSDDGDEGSTNGAAAAKVLIEFFDHALTPESLIRFRKLTHDPDRYVSTEVLSETVAWLMEQYTDRPTEDSSR